MHQIASPSPSLHPLLLFCHPLFLSPASTSFPYPPVWLRSFALSPPLCSECGCGWAPASSSAAYGPSSSSPRSTALDHHRTPPPPINFTLKGMATSTPSVLDTASYPDPDFPFLHPLPPAPPPIPTLPSTLSSYISSHYPRTPSHLTFHSSSRYLIFAVGDDGLGNKILPLVSSFLLALLLNRTFLVHWTGSEAVHNTPMRIDELYRPPKGMQWDVEQVARRSMWAHRALMVTEAAEEKERIFSLLKVFGEKRRVKVEELRQLFDALQLSMKEVDMRTADYGLVKERALCDDWREEYRDTQVLLVYGDQYFVPPLQVNVHYRPIISRLFNDTDIFGPLARWLLRPSTDVEAYIEPFMEKRFTPFTVGLQLRRRERLGLKDSEVQLALRCARDIVAAHRAQPGHLGEAVSFFVASDDNSLRQSVRQQLENVGPVAFTDEFMVREDMTRGLFYAVVDSMLLSHTSAIVVTPSSTFGYISHAYGSLVPWRASLHPATECHRAVSAEPSAHFWQPLMREAQRQCINKTDFPTLMAQEECCPRWG